MVTTQDERAAPWHSSLRKHPSGGWPTCRLAPRGAQTAVGEHVRCGRREQMRSREAAQELAGQCYLPHREVRRVCGILDQL